MLKKLAFAGALLATFAGAHAQSSQNFGVTGTVTPGACNVTLTGGGIVDTGSVSQGTAKTYALFTSANAVYSFPGKSVPINISCAAATKVGVSFVDNKAAQKLAFDSNDVVRYGVGDGAAGTTPIGLYTVEFTTATTIDTVAVGQFLTAANGSATFSTTQPSGPGYGPNVAAPGRTVGFAKVAGATVPEAFTTLAGTLFFSVYVSKPYIDAATTVVTPTGSGTLTLVYL